eukprot:RCo045358
MLLHPAVQGKLDSIFATKRLFRQDLDQKALVALSRLSPEVGVKLLSCLDGQDSASVKNLSAYFMGIMKRGVVSTENLPDLSVEQYPCTLDSRVQAVIDSFCGVGILERMQIDEMFIQRLAGFHPDEALVILQELLDSDLDRVDNTTAFTMGIIKKHRGQVHRRGLCPSSTPRCKASWTACSRPAWWSVETWTRPC